MKDEIIKEIKEMEKQMANDSKPLPEGFFKYERKCEICGIDLMDDCSCCDSDKICHKCAQKFDENKKEEYMRKLKDNSIEWRIANLESMIYDLMNRKEIDEL